METGIWHEDHDARELGDEMGVEHTHGANEYTVRGSWSPRPAPPLASSGTNDQLSLSLAHGDDDDYDEYDAEYDEEYDDDDSGRDLETGEDLGEDGCSDSGASEGSGSERSPRQQWQQRDAFDRGQRAQYEEGVGSAHESDEAEGTEQSLDSLGESEGEGEGEEDDEDDEDDEAEEDHEAEEEHEHEDGDEEEDATGDGGDSVVMHESVRCGDGDGDGVGAGMSVRAPCKLQPGAELEAKSDDAMEEAAG